VGLYKQLIKYIPQPLRNGYSNSITIEKQRIKLYNHRKMAHQTTELLNNRVPKASLNR
jgi:hypothetical protein